MRVTMIPFSVMSYLLGLTSVKFRDYFLGTLAVTIHIAIWLYVGSTLTYFDIEQQGNRKKSNVENAVILVQFIFAIGVAIYISIIAKRELNKRLQNSDQNTGKSSSIRETEMSPIGLKQEDAPNSKSSSTKIA